MILQPKSRFFICLSEKEHDATKKGKREREGGNIEYTKVWIS
jgi:hypothetical protein